jgi:hypothetical protein
MLSNWNVERGRRSPYKAQDVFFMLLTVLKNGGTCDSLGLVFRIPGPSFEKVISGKISPFLYQHSVKDLCRKITMSRLVNTFNGIFFTMLCFSG